MTPRVSVIVPVRNGAVLLPGLIEALERQTLAQNEFEVLVSDDGSTDGGCDDLGSPAFPVRVLRGEPRTSYAARNRAASVARGHVLAFTDSDCTPRPEWLECGLAALADADVAAGAVRFDVADGIGIWGMADIDTSLDQERAVANGTAATANLFVRGETFRSLDGFDATLPSNGDHDFVRRALDSGARLCFAASAVVVHPLRDDAREFLTKHWRVNRAWAVRRARDGRSVSAWGLLVPIYRPLCTRRSMGRSVRLERGRLGAHGVQPTVVQDVAGLALIYGLLPACAAAARFAGWREGFLQHTRKQRDMIAEAKA